MFNLTVSMELISLGHLKVICILWWIELQLSSVFYYCLYEILLPMLIIVCYMLSLNILARRALYKIVKNKFGDSFKIYKVYHINSVRISQYQSILNCLGSSFKTVESR